MQTAQNIEVIGRLIGCLNIRKHLNSRCVLCVNNLTRPDNLECHPCHKKSSKSIGKSNKTVKKGTKNQ